MFKKKIIWTNFADGKNIYEMFKDYGIDCSVKDFIMITYVRISYDGKCQFRWTPLASTAEKERDAYEDWVQKGYTELKMFEEDKEYAGTI